jgi:hypothetical protein
VVEAVRKISSVRPVESWADLSVQARRLRFATGERQRRRTPTQETILRQTTRLDLEEKQISLDNGATRLEARQRRLEMIQVQEQITRQYGSAGIFKQLVHDITPPATQPTGAAVPAVASQMLMPTVAMPTRQVRTNAAISAAAYERTGTLPAPLPGGQVNLLA